MPAVPATGGGRHGRLLGIPHRRLRHRIQFGLPERSQKQAYICGCEGTDSRGASERRTDAREAKRIKRGGRDGRTGGDPAQRCTDKTDRVNGLIYRSMQRSRICTGTGLPPPTSAPGLGSPLSGIVTHDVRASDRTDRRCRCTRAYALCANRWVPTALRRKRASAGASEMLSAKERVESHRLGQVPSRVRYTYPVVLGTYLPR